VQNYQEKEAFFLLNHKKMKKNRFFFKNMVEFFVKNAHYLIEGNIFINN